MCTVVIAFLAAGIGFAGGFVLAAVLAANGTRS